MKKSITIEPRTAPKTYSIRYFDPITGQRMRVKAESDEELKKLTREIEDRLDSYQPGKGDPKAIPLVVMEDYFTFLLTCDKPRRKTTIEMKRKNLTPFIEQLYSMDQLTNAKIQSYIVEMRQAKRAVDTIAIRLRDIRAFCNWLHKKGIVGTNPFLGIGIPVSTFEGRRLTLEELKPLFHAMSGNLLDFMGLKFETGTRKGEILQLEFNDINFDLRYWSLRGIEGKSKSKRDRIIPLSTQAIEMLKRRKKEAVSSYVFALYTKNMVQNDWGNALEVAGITGRVRPHDIRHTWASMFKGRRASLKALAGWSSDLMLNKYQHVEAEELREDMDKSHVSNLWK